MNPRDLRHLILKGILAWSVLSVLVWYFGDGMIKALFPLLKAVMSALAPDFSHSLKLSDSVQSQLDAPPVVIAVIVFVPDVNVVPLYETEYPVEALVAKVILDVPCTCRTD